MEFNVPVFTALSPDRIVLQIKKDIKELTVEINHLINDLKLWEDNNNLKEYLKGLNIPSRKTHNIQPWMPT